jgi:uncharacterized protein YcaQ
MNEDFPQMPFTSLPPNLHTHDPDAIHDTLDNLARQRQYVIKSERAMVAERIKKLEDALHDDSVMPLGFYRAMNHRSTRSLFNAVIQYRAMHSLSRSDQMISRYGAR